MILYLRSSRIISKNAYVAKIKSDPASVDSSVYDNLLCQLKDYPSVINKIKEYEYFRESGVRYYNYFVNYSDRCYHLVNLGVINDPTKPYIVELSLQDLLPFIFHRITGCDIHCLDNIENINEYSKALLNLDFDNMDIPLNVFLHRDIRLDEYFNSIAAAKAYDIVDKVISDIQKELMDIKEGICSQIAHRNSSLNDRDKLIPLSYGFSSIIFKTGNPFEEEIELDDVVYLYPRCGIRGTIPSEDFIYGGVK